MMDKKIRYIAVFSLFSLFLLPGTEAAGQRPVPQQRMERVYDEVKTPYKYGLVVVPDHDYNKIDSPTVFRYKKKWYMTYVLYDGKYTTDGRGYETWLAESDDLLHWNTLGRLLSLCRGTWDSFQRGGYMSLIAPRWGGSYRPRMYDGRYWLSYIGGDSRGYEAGTLCVGMASTDKDISQAHEWTGADRPVMSPQDSDAGAWEKYTLYKSYVFRDPGRRLHAPFVMYYNAKGAETGKESIGVAVSRDLSSWERCAENPVLEHGEGITGDAQVQKMGDLYVMFYFGAMWKDKEPRAFNRFACSYDLVHWTDWNGGNLIEPSEPYDDLYAHKSWVIKYRGTVYHFYCAVNSKDQRGIAVAMSRDMGKSSLAFK